MIKWRRFLPPAFASAIGVAVAWWHVTWIDVRPATEWCGRDECATFDDRLDQLATTSVCPAAFTARCGPFRVLRCDLFRKTWLEYYDASGRWVGTLVTTSSGHMRDVPARVAYGRTVSCDVDDAEPIARRPPQPARPCGDPWALGCAEPDFAPRRGFGKLRITGLRVPGLGTIVGVAVGEHILDPACPCELAPGEHRLIAVDLHRRRAEAMVTITAGEELRTDLGQLRVSATR